MPCSRRKSNLTALACFLSTKISFASHDGDFSFLVVLFLLFYYIWVF